ncbi:MAG: DNA cytosine methyltransferase [Alphaproteobacteria bacterium]|nr:DNA cytosine methyltransferase [Alphaproteobacteria bacterium]
MLDLPSLDIAPDEITIDSFAGGGGASLGIWAAFGRSPDVAINHDPEAVALHQANHPDTLHICQSVWKASPRDVRDAAARHRGLDPKTARVGLLWASPDCKDFSKAKGATPRSKNIRDLAWVVVHYAQQVQPRVIILENVEEFRDWAPLRQISDERGQPVEDLFGNPVLERIPTRKGETFRRWIRALKQAGYKIEYREMRAYEFGGVVLDAAPTIRKRLIVIARRDGKAIRWPEVTHAKPNREGLVPAGLKPWRIAAECIDWTVPCLSIFLSRAQARALKCKRPLADATLARIARGVKRYVIDNPSPFLLPVANDGTILAPHVTKFRTGATGHAMAQPLATVTANSHTAQGREGGAPPLGIVAASLVQTGYGERASKFRCLACDELFDDAHATAAGGLAPAECPKCGEEDRIAIAERGQRPRTLDLDRPLGTVVAGGAKHAAVAAFLAQHNTGMIGHDARKPVSTLTGTGSHQAVVSAALVRTAHGERDKKGKRRGRGAHGVDEALPTVTASRDVALVAPIMSHAYTSNTAGGQGSVKHPIKTITAGGQHHAIVAGFLAKYYGDGGQSQRANEPAHTIPTKARLAAVTVKIDGVTYAIVDIGMRMLTPRELYRAQGFPDSYLIDVEIEETKAVRRNGNVVHVTFRRKLSKAAQIRMCGNSVCPPLAEALVRANFAAADVRKAAA